RPHARRPVRACRGAPTRVDVHHQILALDGRRGRWQHGYRPRLRRSARPQHRRRDHGPGQVRPTAGWSVDQRRHRRGVARLVGAEPAVPHASVRAHPSPAPIDRDGGRHRVPLRRRQPTRGARPRPSGGRRSRRAHRRWPHDGARLPRRRPHRRPPRRTDTDPARPRRPPVGGVGRHRGALRRRSRLVTERRRTRDLHASI
ncbi:MAG: Dihydrofolate reductase homolog, partial [uncultured Chloroflexia bacterium]